MTKVEILFCLLLICVKVQASTTVAVVEAGHLAELPCPSSDDNHRFMFWQLTDDKNIIGPGNPIDENKYNYEVLTGKLFIRGVSTKEAGFYKCVSRGIDDTSSIKIHVVELIVRSNWDNVSESNFESNLLRAMAIIMVIIVSIAILLLVLIVRRKRNTRFFEMEESRENSPEKYISNIQTIPMPHSSRVPTTTGIENAGLDDFPKVFDHMQK